MAPEQCGAKAHFEVQNLKTLASFLTNAEPIAYQHYVELTIQCPYRDRDIRSWNRSNTFLYALWI